MKLVLYWGGGSAPFSDMLRQANCHLSFSVVSPSSVHLTNLSLSAGSVPCLEVEAVAVLVVVVGAAAALLPLHPSRLHCQSINSQTIATGEKKC